MPTLSKQKIWGKSTDLALVWYTESFPENIQLLVRQYILVGFVVDVNVLANKSGRHLHQ